MIAIVVAYGANRVIGRDGGLPWRIPSDMRHFKALTVGHTVLMGRRTFASLPAAFRPLPQRRNLVLSSDPAFDPGGGAEAFTGLDSALAACGGDCFVIGGAAVYEEALPLADRVHATEIAAAPDGDTRFPALPEGEWECVARGEPISENGHTFEFVVYERRRG